MSTIGLSRFLIFLVTTNTNWVEPEQDSCTNWIEPEQRREEKRRVEKAESGQIGGERCFQRKPVWVAADCEWYAAAPRLKPIRLPRARSPGMGEGGDW